MNLEQDFTTYLQNNLESSAVLPLVEALIVAGLTDEANALKAYSEQGAGTSYTLQNGPYAGKSCTVSSLPPTQYRPRDLWFDIVELTFMVFVPDPNDPEVLAPRHAVLPAWISTQPVYVWQFRSFLQLVKERELQIDFPRAEDYLEFSRFEQMDSKAFITNIYQDEALSYSAWFSKSLVDNFDLRAARQFLNPLQFELIIPTGMKFWDAPDEPSEFERMAYGQENLDRKIIEDINLIREDLETYKNKSDRIIYDEWEKLENVGLSTSLPLAFAKSLPWSYLPKTIYSQLENIAPRP